jgi:gliding motility-associated-like protein
MRQSNIFKRITLLLALVFSFNSLLAQTTVIQGPTCVAPGVEYQYVAAGGWTSTSYMQWCLVGGHISGTYDLCKSGTAIVYIRVIWDNTGTTNTSGKITLYMSTPGSTSGNTIVNLTITPVLKPGSLTSNINQAVPYYTLPATINASVATGGGCTPNYAYQWQSSKDKVTWTDVAGKTTQNLAFTTPAQETFYYRRKVTELYSSTVLYTDIATVAVVNTPPPVNPDESCTGILGPAVIAVNFGTGNNPGPALPAGATSYTYTSGLASSGNYTIRNSTTGYRSQWYSIPADHTPNDVNGYMMLIDGANEKGDFYRTRVTGLTSNFRYEFSAWVANIDVSSSPEDPSITFNIYSTAGVLLGTSKAKAVPYSATFAWQRISFMFDVPRDVSTVDIAVTNNHKDPIGNDLVLDDIAFAPCYPPVLASFSNTSIIDKKYSCYNGNATVYASWPSTIPFPHPAYKWQRSIGNTGSSWADIPGATALSYTQTEYGPNIYQYRVIAYESTDPSRFVISNNISFFVQNLVVNAATFPVLGCNSAPYQLNPTFQMLYADPAGPVLTYTYAWSPATYLSNAAILNPTVSLPALPPNPNPSAPEPAPVNYNYSLNLRNTNFGCVGGANIVVAHQNPRTVYVPNAFTPNGDGVNDVFRPLNLEDYAGGIFRVYNRWGQMIYEETVAVVSPNRMHGWDGTYQSMPQDAGVFTWIVIMPACTSNISPGSSGTVTLIR